MKVLIADDIMILRQGIKAVLEQDSEIEVVALAENGKQAFEKMKVYQPDVILMDMRMPDYDGAYGTKCVKEYNPNVKVLILTTFDDEETITKALESGADGYILKESEDHKIIAAVKSIYSGMSIFGGSVYHVMREQMAKQKQNEDAVISLTDREKEIVKLVGQGFDSKEIANTLFLAEGTVRNNISKILEKLELKDRTQLAVYAVKHGLD